MYNELEPLLRAVEKAIRPARAQQPRLTYGPLIGGAELNALTAKVKPTK
jgi:hypothetical protein